MELCSSINITVETENKKEYAGGEAFAFRTCKSVKSREHLRNKTKRSVNSNSNPLMASCPAVTSIVREVLHIDRVHSDAADNS